MTNEQLAAAARDGDEVALVELWQRVRHLVNRRAASFAQVAELDGAVDLTDLQQDAAEVFLQFVKKWRDDLGCKFNTALSNQIRWKLYKRLDIRRKYSADSPRMVSLDTPVLGAGGEDDGLTLQDRLEDESAQVPFDLIAPRADIGAAVAALPEDQQQVIRYRFRYGMEWEGVGRTMGVTVAEARNICGRALAALRRNYRLREYRPSGPVEWRHVTLAEYNRTFTSSVEAAVIHMDDLTI